MSKWWVLSIYQLCFLNINFSHFFNPYFNIGSIWQPDLKIPKNITIGSCELVQIGFSTPLEDQEKESRHEKSQEYLSTTPNLWESYVEWVN